MLSLFILKQFRETFKRKTKFCLLLLSWKAPSKPQFSIYTSWLTPQNSMLYMQRTVSNTSWTQILFIKSFLGFGISQNENQNVNFSLHLNNVPAIYSRSSISINLHESFSKAIFFNCLFTGLYSVQSFCFSSRETSMRY